jgi:competence ComEA-like helix-hairpin-helix protein
VGRVRGHLTAGALSLMRFLAGFLLLTAAFDCRAQTRKQPPEKPLDLNRATVEELKTVPGISPALAKEIVRFREKSGPFRRLEDLLAIRGITKSRLKKIRPYLTVTPPQSHRMGDLPTRAALLPVPHHRALENA